MAETLMFDYHRQHGIGIALPTHICFFQTYSIFDCKVPHSEEFVLHLNGARNTNC